MVVIVAFSEEAWRDRLSQLLERHGLTVRLRCASGHEAVRLAQAEPVLIVSGWRLTDMTAGQLAQRVAGRGYVLVMAKAVQVTRPQPNMRLIALPTTSSTVVTAVKALAATTLPPPPPADDALWQAKRLLIERRGMTEEQAHRFLQRQSMDSSRPVNDVAHDIIKQLT